MSESCGQEIYVTLHEIQFYEIYINQTLYY